VRLVNRLIVCLIALAMGVDLIVQTLALSLIYVPFAILKPNPRRSISGLMGWAAARGYRWGRIGAAWIDGIFGTGHCARSAAFDQTFNEELT